MTSNEVPALDDALAWGLVEAAPDALILVDESGEILLVNRQTQDIFQYDRAELVGRPIEELLPERFRSVHRAHRTRYRAAPDCPGDGGGAGLVRAAADGSEFPVEISLSPLRTGDGLRIVATVRDITERVEAGSPRPRRRSDRRCRPGPVAIFDAKTLQFTHVNRGLVEQVGYSKDELLGMTMLHIAPEFTEERLHTLLARFELEDSSSQTFVTVHRHRDGDGRPRGDRAPGHHRRGRPTTRT